MNRNGELSWLEMAAIIAAILFVLAFIAAIWAEPAVRAGLNATTSIMIN